MNDPFENAVNVSLIMLSDLAGQTPTDEQLAQVVSQVLLLGPFKGLDRERLIRELESRYSILVQGYSILRDDQYYPWVQSKKQKREISWHFWPRYRRFIGETKKFPPKVVAQLDDLTDVTLDHLRDPASDGSWDRRGLVVGDVQSGKTSNYIGLICKAVDSGFKIVIVLAGVHNNLRSQTQLRVDEGFLGFDTRKNFEFGTSNRLIGVGALPGPSLLVAHSLTNSNDNGDFSRKVASSVSFVFGSDPVVLVVKKNARVLRNLLNWALAFQGEEDPLQIGKRVVRNVPLLVIDDEADLASVNTNDFLDEEGNIIPDHDPTTINKLIRQLLNSFEKSCYVGYTATPFANVFMHHEAIANGVGDDLFPDSFILNVPAPSNYIGPVTVFGLDQDDESSSAAGLPIIRPILDSEDVFPMRHNKHLAVGCLPESLHLAIYSFLISTAIRLSRGEENIHNSMLIHVTRFQNVQSQVTQLVKDLLDEIRRKLEFGASADASNLSSKLRQLWERDYLPTTQEVQARFNQDDLPEVTWDQVDAGLYQVAASIQVREINGYAKEALDYYDHKNGLSVIAVGGDKLSRGMTLEGLTVSYFVRTSRMYDTLMQMGRWFGYRPSYVDVCRLYTSPVLVDWYTHIAAATLELRQEFDLMYHKGLTPRQYGHRVLTHPDGLLVTSATKMRAAKLTRIGYAGSMSESVAFHLDERTVSRNFNSFDQFLKSLTRTERYDNCFVWRGVPGEEIALLFDNIDTPPASWKAQSASLARYVRGQLQREALIEWTVALMASGTLRPFEIAGYGGKCVKRKRNDSADQTLYQIGRLVSPEDETIDLSPEQRAAALEATRETWHRKGEHGKEPERPSGPQIREQRPPQHGLLLIYPIDPEIAPLWPTPLLGFALSFPADENAEAVEYLVNSVYWEQEFD